MIPTKKQISSIILALMADVKFQTGLPVSNYDPDNLVGSKPELKLKFIGANDLSVNLNKVLNNGVVKFQLQLTNEIVGVETIALTIEAILKVAQVVNIKQTTYGEKNKVFFIDGIRTLSYEVLDNDIYQVDEEKYIKIYDLNLTIGR